MTRILDGESVSRRDSPGQSGDKEDGMRVIRLLPLGFVVAAGVVLLGCGDSGSAPATEATSSDLMVRPKASPFESIVKQKNLASDIPGFANNLVGTLINGWGVSFDPRTGR